MEIDFFGRHAINRPGSARKKILETVKENIFSDSFKEYGYDYFDNPALGIGYGGYRYDGRFERIVDEIIAHYNLKPGNRILEIGCAKGYVLVEFLKKGFVVAGIDKSRYAVENAHPDVRQYVSVGNGTCLNYSNGYFDFVFSKDVLPMIPASEVEGVIKECIRVSKGNIFFEIQTGNTQSELDCMMRWDVNHHILKQPEWWKILFESMKYPGDVNFKTLIPEI